MIISDDENEEKNIGKRRILISFHAKENCLFPKNCLVWRCDENAKPLSDRPDFIVNFLQFNKVIDLYEAIGYIKGSFGFYSVIKKIEILFDLKG